MPVYCVTGSNRGLGLEFVRQLAKNPDNVILATTRPDADVTDLNAVASPTTYHLECDTSSVPSIHLFANRASRKLGDRKIDFLINNAGTNLTTPSENSLSLDPSSLAQQVAVNVTGPAKVVEFLLDHGALEPSVRILNVSSGLGSIELSSKIQPRVAAGYSISKAALNMLTVHQSADLRSKLTDSVVISIDPGWVKTRMGGEGAVLDPETSISGMLNVLNSLSNEDTGAFFGHDGEKRPW